VIDRRTFLHAMAGGVALPLAAEAQQARKIWRIGVIGYAPTTAEMIGPNPKIPAVSALLAGLHQLGYVYGQHYVTEPRGAEGKQERFASIVADLVRLQVDVIVGVSAALPALKLATSTIPIVILGTPDPVGSGYAQSLARPGGNFTGLSFQMFETIGNDSSCSSNSSRLRRRWRFCGIQLIPKGGRRRKQGPDKGVGTYCRSRFGMLPRSTRLSGQPRMRKPMRYSWLPGAPLIRTPGE
jgi:hypothetical protein